MAGTALVSQVKRRHNLRLREAYPDLPPQEAHLLVCASVRVYRQRMQDQAAHLPRPEEIVMPQAAA